VAFIVIVLIRRRAKSVAIKKLIAKGYTEETKEEIDRIMEAYFQKMLAKNPDDIQLRSKLALLYYHQQKHREALQQWTIVTDLDPNNPEIFKIMGNTCVEMNDLREAIKYYRKAVAADPHDTNGYNLLGIASFKTREYSEAIKYWKKVVKAEPHNARTYHNMGVASREIHKLYNAIAYFQKAATLGNEESQEWLRKNGYGW
jgi:tetratricopeptide (TPR) repeat protein